MKFLRFLALVIVIITVSSLFGQGTTSTLIGTATTADGKSPMPGVNVTLHSTSLQGTRTTQTGEKGGYLFPSLPPGDYTVDFELEGMQKVTKHVVLSLATTARVDANLRVTSVAESITVTASAPAVLETTEVSTNFTRANIDNLPMGRGITDAVALAPGAHTGINGLAISGAYSFDNLYLVNGVAVNENLRGQPHDLFIEDAIQEITVLGGGSISAEYGRFTGGVVTTITKSGGNEFSGSVRDNLTNAAWLADSVFRNPASGLKAPRPTSDLNHRYEGTLGGFVMKDRIWFFGSGRQSNQSFARLTAITVIPYTETDDQRRWEGKVTGQITSHHSLVASYINVSEIQQANAAVTPLDLQSLRYDRKLPNHLLALTYNGVLTNNFALEGLYTNKYFAFVHSGSPFTDRINGTAMEDIPSGDRYWSSTFCAVCKAGGEQRNSWSEGIKGTYFLNSATLGSHSIAVGGEQYVQQRINDNHQEGSDFYILSNIIVDPSTKVVYPSYAANSRLIWNPILTSSEGDRLATTSVYVNDKWDFNSQFSFNLGARFDKNNGRDASFHTVSDDSALSPRLGIQYRPGSGRNHFTANYARYVTKIAEGDVGQSAEQAGRPATITFAYTGPSLNARNADGTPVLPFNQLFTTAQMIQKMYDWFDANGGTSMKPLSSSVPGFSTTIQSPISSTHVDEKTIGWGSQLGNSAFLRADLIVRDWGNFYAQQLDRTTGKYTDPYGNTGDLSVLVNDDKFTTRKYRGLDLQGTWRPMRYDVGFSYTYSTLKGNDGGENSANGPLRNAPGQLVYPEYQNYANRRPSGYLSDDIRHRLRAWAGRDFNTVIGTVNISLLQNYESGAPYSYSANIDASGKTFPYSGVPDKVALGYTLSGLTDNSTYFFSKRGEFREKGWTRTDLAVNYHLPFRKNQIFIEADMFNIFNEHSLLTPSRAIITRRSSTVSDLLPFNPFTDTPVEGVNWRLSDRNHVNTGLVDPTKKGQKLADPRTFGEATAVTDYQPARSYNFAVGFRF